MVKRDLLIGHRHNYRRLLLNSRGAVCVRAFSPDIFIYKVEGESGRVREGERKGAERQGREKRSSTKETLRLHFALAADPPIVGSSVWVRRSVAHAPIHQDHVKATFLNQTARHLLHLSVFPCRAGFFPVPPGIIAFALKSKLFHGAALLVDLL